MTWAAPWAFAGVALLAIPLVIHLLGLGRAPARRVPSVRFIPAARLQPARRTRVHDVALLGIRVGALGAAILALARPVPGGVKPRASDHELQRVVIVDTSASMRRGGADAMAARIADTARGVVLRTAHPADALGGAAGWLETQPGPGEIAVISDFQVGAVDSEAITSVAPDIVIRLVRAGRADPARPVQVRFAEGGRIVTATATVHRGRTDVAWSGSALMPAAAAAPTAVLAAPADRRAVEAAWQAAGMIATPAGTIATPEVVAAPNRQAGLGQDAVARVAGDSVVVVLPTYDGRPALLRNASPPAVPWEGDAIADVMADRDLSTDAEDLRTGVVRIGGRDRLAFFAATSASDPATLPLIAAVRRVTAQTVAAAELEPSVLSDSALDALRAVANTRPDRAARGATVAGRDAERRLAEVTGDMGDAAGTMSRWLWALVLALLGVEAIVRRVGDGATRTRAP